MTERPDKRDEDDESRDEKIEWPDPRPDPDEEPHETWARRDRDPDEAG